MRYLRNLSSSETFAGKPWEFTDLARVPVECIADKKARDIWANSPSTDFCMYSLYEGVQANLRLHGESAGQESNPPLLMHGLAVDYDAPTTAADVAAAVRIMDGPKPNWHETTLSGHARLLWMFEEPLRFPSRRFAVHALKSIDSIIPLDRLPGLDRPALLTPERYWTNGCQWVPLSKILVPASQLRGFILRVSEKFNWAAKELGRVAVSMERLADELRKRYPRFSEWETEFAIGSQGPSFFVQGSTSPKSAIVRDTGIYTFSASAHKPFFSWEELVGKEFCTRTEDEIFGEATKDVYFDGKSYFMPHEGAIRCYDAPVLRRQLIVHKGLSDRKPKDGGSSAVDRAMAHLELHNFIDGAASCAFYPKNVFTFNNKRVLNTHRIEALKPAPGVATWGSTGPFPFLSEFFDGFFAPKLPQREIFLAWLQYFYKSCLDRSPRSGQGVVLAGGVNTGKTFTSRGIVGGLVGGCAEANSYFVQSDNFNSSLFDHALWVVDDGSMSTTSSMHRLFSESVKRGVANREHRVNEKFRRAVMVPWQGRIFITVNDDPVSISGIPALDGSIMEKLLLLRVGPRSIAFRSQPEMEKILQAELPYFANWLLAHQPPAHCFGGDPRFGVVAYCEESLRRTSNLSSVASSFAEILQKWLVGFFQETHAPYWEGSVTDLRLAMSAVPAFAEVLRGHKPNDFPRILLQLNDKKFFNMSVTETDNGRVFRIESEKRFLKPSAPGVPQAVGSTFEKP